MHLLKYLAIIGNVVFILWVTYNGIDEGFKGTPVQLASYIGLTAVLVLDIFLLTRKK
ncbi:MAG: hypothetical protein ABSD69_00775 [Candidatus Levyibacteriota bacterium]|jgi:hypothetical protein